MDLVFEVTDNQTAAQVPTYGTFDAAGMDLYCPIDVLLPARSKVNIPLNIKVDIPVGHFLKFESRSGLSWNYSIETGAGVIDYNFKKILGLVLYNHGDEDYQIKAGDRVSQAILMEYVKAEPVKGVVLASDRGGMGSTGR